MSSNEYYKKTQKRYLLWLSSGSVALLIVVFVYLTSGPLTPSLKSFFTCFGDADMLYRLWINRGYRVVSSLFVGSSLSIAGLTYQILFRNRMASPDILGVSQGASVGAALGISCNSNTMWIQGGAFIGGIIAVVLSLALSKLFSTGRHSTVSMILAGIIVSGGMNCAIGCIKYFSPANSLSEITFWMLGSLDKMTGKNIWYYVPAMTICLILIYVFRNKCNLLKNGDEDARLLGLDVHAARLLFIVLATLLTALTVSLSGTISFIGLAIPNMIMLITGSDAIRAFPLSIVYGALFTCICDLLSRTLSTSEIPIGIITSGAGAVLFTIVAIIVKKKGCSHNDMFE